jgi:hypothetical protein
VVSLGVSPHGEGVGWGADAAAANALTPRTGGLAHVRSGGTLG